MDPQYQQIIDYVRTHLAQGYTQEQLADHMRRHGWTDEQVAWAFTHAAVPTAPEPAAPAMDTQSATAPPQKYGLFRAAADTVRALARNFVSLIVAVVLSVIVLGVATFAISFLLPLLMLATQWSHSEAVQIITLLVVSVILFVVVYTAAGALFVGVLARVVADGMAGKKSSPPLIVKQSLRQVGRLALVGLYVAWRIGWPMLAVLVVALLLSRVPVLSTLVVVLGTLAAAVWVLIASLRYILSTMVAIFEPELPILQCPGRSYHLLQRGGQWFIVKAVLADIVIVVLLALVTRQTLDELQATNSWPVLIFSLLLELLWTGILVALYLNRRAVRG